MYHERPARLDGAVVWTNAPSHPVHRILPDGCIDIVWADGELFVAGPDTGPVLATGEVGTVYNGVRFRPGVAPTLLGLSAAELRDRRVDLSAIWPGAEVRRLTERLGEARDPGRELERLLLTIPRRPVERWIPHTVERLRAGWDVRGIAEELRISERQLHRRSLAAFGYGPKTLLRILRLGRALDLARAGTPPAMVAAETGYADQPHLARDVRDLAGVPLRTLLTER